MLTLLFKFLSFYSAGTESGKAENDGISPQKRKAESEKDNSEPKEKKLFSMSLGKPLTKTGIGLGKKTPQTNPGESKQGISMSMKSSSSKPAPIKMALSSQVCKVYCRNKEIYLP